jgi:hypothetical protein
MLRCAIVDELHAQNAFASVSLNRYGNYVALVEASINDFAQGWNPR